MKSETALAVGRGWAIGARGRAGRVPMIKTEWRIPIALGELGLHEPTIRRTNVRPMCRIGWLHQYKGDRLDAGLGYQACTSRLGFP